MRRKEPRIECRDCVAGGSCKTATPAAADWATESLARLTAHIVDTHHDYCKKELPRLAVLSQKVVNRHGGTLPDVATIQSKLTELSEDLTQHLAKEEIVLFPYIAKLERAMADGSAKPRGCFASVANPIAMMTQEHDATGILMGEIRQLSQDFTPPGAPARPSMRSTKDCANSNGIYTSTFISKPTYCFPEQSQ